MHRTNCDLDNHAPDLFEIRVEHDGTYTVCCCCGAQLIADGPYTISMVPGEPSDLPGVFREGIRVALCHDGAMAQRIAALLNFAHPDTGVTT